MRGKARIPAADGKIREPSAFGPFYNICLHATGVSELPANQANLQTSILAKNPPRVLGLGEGCVGVADGT